MSIWSMPLEILSEGHSRPVFILPHTSTRANKPPLLLPTRPFPQTPFFFFLSCSLPPKHSTLHNHIAGQNKHSIVSTSTWDHLHLCVCMCVLWSRVLLKLLSRVEDSPIVKVVDSQASAVYMLDILWILQNFLCYETFFNKKVSLRHCVRALLDKSQRFSYWSFIYAYWK